MRKIIYLTPEMKRIEFSSFDSILTGSNSSGSSETMILDEWSYRRDWE